MGTTSKTEWVVVVVDGAQVRLTMRQARYLARAQRAEHFAEPMTQEVARQIVAKGYGYKLHTYTRYEWNRPVASMPVVQLTATGRAVGEAVQAEFVRRAAVAAEGQS